MTGERPALSVVVETTEDDKDLRLDVMSILNNGFSENSRKRLLFRAIDSEKYKISQAYKGKPKKNKTFSGPFKGNDMVILQF